jgi:DNA-binding beta-propeller fold protein YncE
MGIAQRKAWCTAMVQRFNGLKVTCGCLIAFAFFAISRAQSGDAGKANADNQVLQLVADVPLPGPAVRFDYQSLDIEHSRLYIAHMNADQLVVFDTLNRRVIASLDGFKRVHGVIAVPAINRVFASVTGEHQMAAVDMKSLKTIATAGPINYPDGLAYAPESKRVFVSDEHGGVDAVVDAKTSKLLTSIPLGGGAGNTVYDPGSERILVAVHGENELVAIDPMAMKIIGRYPLPGIENPHGIAVDVVDRLAFIAGEENYSLAVFDLKSMKLLSVHPVGDDPDVLAFDAALKRLYISAESGTVTVFQESDHDLRLLGQLKMPRAHTVSVDPRTHLVYFPLENVEGHPVLRIMKPNILP